MSTSGTVTYNQNQLGIITDALILLNVLGANEVPEPTDIQFCSRILNKMVKAWEGQGIHLWTNARAILFTQLNQESYSLSSSSTDNCTNSYVSTTLTANAVAADVSLTVASTTGMLEDDYIGIQLDSGFLQWTTIDNVTSSTSVVIQDALTGAATSGNVIYAYTTKISRPLKVYSGQRSNSGIDIPLWIYSREEYFDLPNKSATGATNSIYYDPQLNSGILYTWPASDSALNLIKFNYSRSIEDFLTMNNTPDFPAEWLEPITAQLSWRIAPAFGKRNLVAALKQDADAMLQSVLEFDNEYASVYFQPAPY